MPNKILRIAKEIKLFAEQALKTEHFGEIGDTANWQNYKS